MSPSLGADFSWLRQEPSEPTEPEQLPAAPLPVVPVPASTNRHWSTIEKIMLTSLLLNAMWFTVYAVRTRPSHR